MAGRQADSILFRAILFDFDGVLVDTERLHLAGFQHALAAHDISLDEASYFARYIGFDDRDAFRVIFDDSGRPLPAPEELARLTKEKARCFAELARERVEVYPGVRELLDSLAGMETGRLRVAIGSGALGRDIELVLGVTEMAQYFETIVAADDVAHSKPDPETYLEACRRLAETEPSLRPAQCLVIEDTPAGLQAATRAGMVTVAVTNTHAAEMLDADLVLGSLAELTLERCASLFDGN
ncbi:MAG: beta-phosphoglucomutase [Hyphomicrobiaceae bacterium]